MKDECNVFEIECMDITSYGPHRTNAKQTYDEIYELTINCYLHTLCRLSARDGRLENIGNTTTLSLEVRMINALLLSLSPLSQ